MIVYKKSVKLALDEKEEKKREKNRKEEKTKEIEQYTGLQWGMKKHKIGSSVSTQIK